MELWRGDRRKVSEREVEVWLIKTWLLKGQNNWTKWNTNTMNNNDKHNSIHHLIHQLLKLLKRETTWSTWSEISCETTVGISCLPKYWKNIITPACMQIPPLFVLAPGHVTCALIYCIIFVQLIKVMLLHQNDCSTSESLGESVGLYELFIIVFQTNRVTSSHVLGKNNNDWNEKYRTGQHV